MLGLAPLMTSAPPLMPSPLPPPLPALLVGQFVLPGTEGPRVDRVGRHPVGVRRTLHLLSRWG
jgi:hypothetical protein